MLYAKNVLALLSLLVKDGTLKLDMNDEITQGRVRHARRQDRQRGGAHTLARSRRMSEHLFIEITVFVLAVFVGFEVISKVPSMLHTPLMSATNAIHGIVVVGAMLDRRRGARGRRPVMRSASPRWCWARSTSSAASRSPTACCEMFKGRTETGRDDRCEQTVAVRRLPRHRAFSSSSACKFLSSPRQRARGQYRSR